MAMVLGAATLAKLGVAALAAAVYHVFRSGKKQFYNENSKGEGDLDWEKLSEHLGSGQYGDVYVWKYREDGFRYAVKEVKVVSQDKTRMLRNEAEKLCKLEHENIVGYLMIRESETRIYMHMELLQGSISSLVLESAVEEDRARSLTCDILDGLVYLHSSNIIHGNIKGENVLIDKHGTAKLADFGLDQYFEKRSEADTVIVSRTICFTAPEVCDGCKPERKSDVWAVACTTYQMMKQSPPFYEAGVDIASMIAKLTHRTLVENLDFSESLKSFLTSAFVRVEVRPQAHVLRKHRWITQPYTS